MNAVSPSNGASSPVGYNVITSVTGAVAQTVGSVASGAANAGNAALAVIGKTAPNFGNRIATAGNSSGIQPFTGAPGSQVNEAAKSAQIAAAGKEMAALIGSAAEQAFGKLFGSKQGGSGNTAVAGAGKTSSGGCPGGNCGAQQTAANDTGKLTTETASAGKIDNPTSTPAWEMAKAEQLQPEKKPQQELAPETKTSLEDNNLKDLYVKDEQEVKDDLFKDDSSSGAGGEPIV